MKSNNRKKGFRIIIALTLAIAIISFSAGQIEEVVFSYSEKNTMQKTLHDANIAIASIEKLGYGTGRLKDIIDEAAGESNEPDFYASISLFKKDIDLLNSLRKKIYLANNDLTMLANQNITAIDAAEKTEYANSAIGQGRYEEAGQSIAEASKIILDSKSDLIESFDLRYNLSVEVLEGIGVNASILIATKKEIDEIEVDGMDNLQVNVMKEELMQLEAALGVLARLNEFSIMLDKRGVNLTQVDDIETEVLYLISSGKFEKSISVLEGIDGLILEEKAAAINIEKAGSELADAVLPEERIELPSNLDEANLLYRDGKFSAAGIMAESVINEIREIRSEKILRESLSKDTPSIREFIKKNSAAIVLAIAIMLLMLIFSRRYITSFIMKKRMVICQDRKKKVYEIMKKLQEEYYIKKRMSKRSYIRQLGQNELRYADLTKEIILLEEKLK